MKKLLDNFFAELEIYEDIYNEKNYKLEIKKSLNKFLNDSNKENALKVYEQFFLAYWIGIQEEDGNPFLEMINKMKDYEETGGKLLDNHRDHFIHSVYVFILGLCIYTKNKKMQDLFYEYVFSTNYKSYYKTNNEEFFYRWGIASLSHDIAYPIEILLKNLTAYSKFLNSYSIDNDSLKMKISFDGFDDFITLSKLSIKEQYIEEFKSQNPNVNLDDYTNIIKIYAKAINARFGIKINDAMADLKNRIDIMNSGAYIDHGFYSGVIVLKWYHSLIKKTNWNPVYFVFPIVDISTSILLHNYYSKGLMDKPFCLPKLEFSKSPIAFLLILCDELQEWERKNFSSNTFDVSKIIIMIENEKMKLTYISNNNNLLNKKSKIERILELDGMLELDIEVVSEGR